MARVSFRKVAVLLGVLASAVSCAGGNSPTATESVSSSTNQAVVASLDSISAVLCDGAPERASSEAEVYTKASYYCIHGSEGVRIDFYESSEQQVAANKVVLDYYASLGDPRTLADLPIGCGALWTFGVDFNETRDVLIAALNASGLPAARC